MITNELESFNQIHQIFLALFIKRNVPNTPLYPNMKFLEIFIYKRFLYWVLFMFLFHSSLYFSSFVRCIYTRRLKTLFYLWLKISRKSLISLEILCCSSNKKFDLNNITHFFRLCIIQSIWHANLIFWVSLHKIEFEFETKYIEYNRHFSV